MELSINENTPLIVNSNDGRTALPKKSNRHGLVMGTLCLGLIVFNVISTVWSKKMYNAYGQDLVFFRQELTNVLYCVWASFFVVYKLVRHPGQLHWFPLWKISFLSFFDALADFLSSVGGVNTPGAIQTLLSQLSLPFTMVTSAVFLRSRYNALACVGATMVILGASFDVLVDLFSGNVATSTKAIGSAVLIFTASKIPSAFSATFKQKFFQSGKGIDVFQLTALVSWIQVAFAWAFVPLLSLPGFGGIPLNQIPVVFIEGAKCFAGDPAIKVIDHGKVTGHCSAQVTLITFIFSVTGFLAGICQLYLFKKGSAVLALVATAIALPLSNIAFSFEWLMGPTALPFSWLDFISLLSVLLGFIMYNTAMSDLIDENDKSVESDTK